MGKSYRCGESHTTKQPLMKCLLTNALVFEICNVGIHVFNMEILKFVKWDCVFDKNAEFREINGDFNRYVLQFAKFSN